MRTVNMTAGNDNEIIWLLKINVEGTEYRFATETVVLSSNTWDGEALGINDNRFSFNEFGKRVNIPGGGTLGEIATVTFSFSRFTANSLIEEFFNEFYPATSGKILVSSYAEIGMIWRGSTSEDDITFLQKYNIEDYQYDDAQILLISSEASEFEYKNIPYYKIQKDNNNGMSYFPNAPKENFGEAIPVVYGDFLPTYIDRQVFNVVYVPAICIEPSKLGFIAACHKVKEPSYQTFNSKYVLYKYIDGLDTYIECYNKDNVGTSVNDVRHYIELQDTVSEILGSAYLKMGEKALDHNAGEVNLVIDNNTTTYNDLEVDAGNAFLSLRVFGKANTSEFGYLSGCSLVYGASSSDNTSRSIGLRIRNEQLQTPGTVSSGSFSLANQSIEYKTLSFGGITTNKKDGTLPWTIEEVCSLGYAIRNNETTAGKTVRVYHCYILLTEIKVIDLLTRVKGSIQRLTPSINTVRFTVGLGFKR